MTDEDFQELRADETAKRFIMSDVKSLAYTQGSGDRLSNFKQLAQVIGVPPGTVLSVYMGKHYLAAMAYFNRGIKSSEGIQSTLHDLSNYTDLALALAYEQEHEVENPDNV